ncbi:MAG: nucleotide exchange factor GrpE [Bacteroidetes bacterium]|nr:nucleotide exchange factor GrpE [Bacteroidota bacterium]MBU1718187.1 nucleotide exchange factor GrpE [Bacteroidota bacterium]
MDTREELDKEILTGEQVDEKGKKSETTEQTPEEKLLAADETIREMNDKFLRLFSEFDNYKKRTNKEKADLIKYGGEELMRTLLPVLDDFERALKAMESNQETDQVKDGIALISSKFRSILQQKGLTEMESPHGKDLDTDFHEAVTEAPAPEENLKGKIIDVLEKGYLLNDKVIRFARVVVGR